MVAVAEERPGGFPKRPGFREKLRLVRRAVGVGTASVCFLAPQMVAGSLFRDYETIPRKAASVLLNLSGIKVSVDDTHLHKRKPGDPSMLVVSNHVSLMDILLLTKVTGGAFVAMSDIAKWPFVGWFGKKVGTIFVQKGQKGRDIPNVHKATVQTLNAGRNVIGFPEGETGRADELRKLKKGFVSVLFKNLSDVPLEQHVLYQPVVSRLLAVNGKSVEEDPSLHDVYAWLDEMSFVNNLQNIFMAESIHIEMKVLPVMDPADYRGYKPFTRELEKRFRRVVETGQVEPSSVSGRVLDRANSFVNQRVPF